MTMVKGVITKGKYTRNHANTLRELGYQVTDGSVIEVNGTYIMRSTDMVDLSENIDQLKEMVRKQELLSYHTPIKFPDGRVLSGVKACSALENLGRGLSALVVKPVQTDIARHGSDNRVGPSAIELLKG